MVCQKKRENLQPCSQKSDQTLDATLAPQNHEKTILMKSMKILYLVFSFFNFYISKVIFFLVALSQSRIFLVNNYRKGSF